MKTAKGICSRCKTRRRVLIVTGPGLDTRGVDMCRKCHQGYKMSLMLTARFAAGNAQKQREADLRADMQGATVAGRHE